MRLAVLLLCLGLAGCSGAVEPDLTGQAWTEVDADLWFTYGRGCGFCTGMGPEGSTLALFRDGSVLWFTIGDSDGGLRFEPGLDPWHDEVRAVVGDREVHVYEVRTAYAADWERVQRRLTDPGAPDYSGCDDCSGSSVEAFDPDIRVVLHGNYEPGDDWDQVFQELIALERAVRRMDASEAS